MNNFYLRMFSLCLLSTVLWVTAAFSQTTTKGPGIRTTSFSGKSGESETRNRIKWSWQLPHTIRRAFYHSVYCNWYIEKMISFNADGKTLYAFYLNNSCMLDGDHLDAFLKRSKLMLTEEGIIVGNNNSE